MIIYAKQGGGDNTLTIDRADSIAKAPKSRGNGFVTLCFRNDTNPRLWRKVAFIFHNKKKENVAKNGW